MAASTLTSRSGCMQYIPRCYFLIYLKPSNTILRTVLLLPFFVQSSRATVSPPPLALRTKLVEIRFMYVWVNNFYTCAICRYYYYAEIVVYTKSSELGLRIPTNQLARVYNHATYGTKQGFVSSSIPCWGDASLELWFNKLKTPRSYSFCLCYL